jgi:hypothetical protein
LHRRRSLLRRFTNMSILRPGSIFIRHCSQFYRRPIGICLAKPVAIYLLL